MKSIYPWRYRKGFALGASTSSKSKNSAAARGIAYHQRIYTRLGKLDLGGELLIEPWFEQIDGQVKRTMRSPDAVIKFPDENCALVVEVKMNWADGKDDKLLNEYLPIVQSAFDYEIVWPVLITGCLRGYKHKPLLGLAAIEQCFTWQPGLPTPVLLQP